MIRNIIIITIMIVIVVAFLIGGVDFAPNKKRDIMITLAMIYNSSLGFISVFTFELIYYFFINRPNGPEYYVPESEHGFNVSLGIALLVFYLVLLSINFYFKKKSGLSIKEYLGAITIAAIAGLFFFIAIMVQI